MGQVDGEKESVSTRGDLASEVKETYPKTIVVTTNCEKSAEAIVPGKKKWEGPNNRKSEERMKGGPSNESRIS